MNEHKKLLPRLGGYLILLIVAFLLLRGWRTSLAGETAVSPTPTTPVSETTTTRQPTNSDGQQLTLDALPVISDTALSPDINPQTYQGTLPTASPKNSASPPKPSSVATPTSAKNPAYCKPMLNSSSYP